MCIKSMYDIRCAVFQDLIFYVVPKTQIIKLIPKL
jgi:hypothetical protein